MPIAAKTTAVVLIVLILLVIFAGCYYGSKPYLEIVDEICRDYSVEPELALAVMKTESNFYTDAESSAGAIGIMQLLPTTAEWICAIRDIEYKQEYLYDAQFNISLGVWYLEYLAYFDNRDWQLAAYNAGEGTVKGWLDNGIALENIPYSETRAYIDKVNKYYSIFKKRNFFD